MYKYTRLILLTVLILSSVILFAQNSLVTGNIRRIGFTEPDSLDKLKKIYPKTAFVHKGVTEYAFNQYSVDTVKLIKGKLSFDDPDPAEIRDICSKNNLDILMLTRLVFIYQKLHKYYHAEADLKFYDRNGSLLFRSDCNSMFGKNYYNYPELFEVERDALTCVIKKFAKEFKLKKKK